VVAVSEGAIGDEQVPSLGMRSQDTAHSSAFRIVGLSSPSRVPAADAIAIHRMGIGHADRNESLTLIQQLQPNEFANRRRLRGE